MSFPLKDSVKRFWSKVDKRGKDECWEWKGFKLKGKFNYGYFWNGLRQEAAHRFSLELKLGRILKGREQSLHHCDNPPCVNPKHLFLGNHLLNMKDMNRKGRRTPQRGKDRWNSKLDEEKVLDIRNRYAAGATIKELEKAFNCHSIQDIVKGREWKHVGGPIQSIDMRKIRNGGDQRPYSLR